MTKEWTAEEILSWEIGMKIGDMNGEWERPSSLLPHPDQVKNIPLISPEKPKQPVPTKPVRRRRIPEVAKKHDKRDGKK